MSQNRESARVVSSALHAAHSANPHELRSTPRIGVWLEGSLWLAGMAGWIRCHVRDIGTGGACVQTPSPFDLASIRRVRFALLDGPIEIDVSGRWQRESLLEGAIFSGLRFESPSPQHVDRISACVHATAIELSRFLLQESELRELGLDEAMDFVLFSRQRNAPASTYAYRGDQEEPGESSLFVVLRGTVALEASPPGRVRFDVGRVERGGAFGGIRLVSRAATRLSAVACSEIVLLELDAAAFRYLERAKPLVARRIAELIVTRSLTHLHACIERLASERR